MAVDRPEIESTLLALRDAAVVFYETGSASDRSALLSQRAQHRRQLPPDDTDDVWYGGRVIEVDQYLLGDDRAMASVAVARASSDEPVWCTGHRLWELESGIWRATEVMPGVDDSDIASSEVAVRAIGDRQLWRRGPSGWELVDHDT